MPAPQETARTATVTSAGASKAPCSTPKRVQRFIHAALSDEAVADAVNNPMFEHVVTGRFHPSVVSASLRPMLDEVLNVATAEDWEAVADQLAADARDALGVGSGSET